MIWATEALKLFSEDKEVMDLVSPYWNAGFVGEPARIGEEACIIVKLLDYAKRTWDDGRNRSWDKWAPIAEKRKEEVEDTINALLRLFEQRYLIERLRITWVELTADEIKQALTARNETG
jgi:hypothetical protein